MLFLFFYLTIARVLSSQIKVPGWGSVGGHKYSKKMLASFNFWMIELIVLDKKGGAGVGKNAKPRPRSSEINNVNN